MNMVFHSKTTFLLSNNPKCWKAFIFPSRMFHLARKILTCSETTLTGESRFHISPPKGIWTCVPCDGKQTGSPLDQWDMVRMKWDCRLSTGLPPAADSVGCEARRETSGERETGTGKLRDQVDLGLHIVGADVSEAPSGWRSQWSDHVGVTNVARQL